MPSNNPDYQKQYIRKHYQENKEYYKEKAVKRKKSFIKKYKSILNRYKTFKGCIDCGYKTDPVALDFDHIGEKVDNISTMINSAKPWRVIKKEVKNCEVRCSNCHRIKHFSQV